MNAALAYTKVVDYLAGLEAATTVEELEAAIQAPFRHQYQGRTWNRISEVRIRKCLEFVDNHPHGHFVPRYGGGRRRILSVCGEDYKVGRGQNSAGVRYCWHYASNWAKEVLMKNGFSKRAAYRLWDSSWADYPHRSLEIIDSALEGRISDPQLNVLIRHDRNGYGDPIRYTVEQNDADKYDRRATKPCACGGTLFDWGASFSEGFDFVNWHCNGCPNVFTEYLRPGELYALRNSPDSAEASKP